MIFRRYIAKAWSCPESEGRGHFLRYCATLISGAIFTLLATLTMLFISTGSAQAATNSTINFQARILQSTGALVPDGDYNVEFKIYDTTAAGASAQGVCSLNSSTDDCWWVETRTGANTVRVVNGYISVNLGSITPFGASIPWSQDLYITMRVGGTGTPSWDTEMVNSTTGRMKLSGVPFSFKTSLLLNAAGTSSFNADNLAQISPTSTQTANSTTAALSINQTGTGQILDLKGNGISVLTLDKTGSAVFGSGVTVGNSSSTTAGTIRWSGTDLEVYNGTGWASLTSGGGNTVNAFTSTYTAGVANVAGTTTGLAVETLIFTSATAVSNTRGVTGFTAPSDGSFRACLIKNNANITGGTLNLRWRVNGVSVGAGACTMNSTNNRQKAENIDSGTVTFLAGDTIGIAFDTSGLTPAGTNDFTVYWTVEYSSGGASSYFQNGGNAFGGTAILGTTDANGLTIITNGVTAASFSSAGDFTLSHSLTVNNGVTISAGGLINNGGFNNSSGGITNVGAISGASTISGSGAITVQSGGTGDLTLNSASGTINLIGSTLKRTGAGTTGVDLIDATGDTTLSLVNSDGGYVANLSVEGAITATGFNGNGSGLTNIDGTAITGTISDSNLSSNVALLNGGQTFTGLTTFSSGAILGNSTSTTAGAIRWSGTDFEGYDGIQWVSLTSGGAGSGGPLSILLIQAYDATGGTDLNTATPTAVPWDSETKKDSGFTHDNVTNNTRVYLDAAGWYKISYNISGANQSASRNTTFCQVRMNGTTYNSPSGSYSYARNTTDAYTTNSSSVYVQTTSANEYYEVLCSQAGSSGAQYAVAGSSWTIAELTTTPTGGGSGTSFDQNGNAFGANGVLGTTDSYDLYLITGGSTALSLTTSNQATFSGEILANGGITVGNASSDPFTINSSSVTLNNSLNFDSNTFVIDSLNHWVAVGTATATNLVTVNTASTTDAAAEVSIYSGGDNNKSLIIQGTSTQIANLFEVQNSSGVAMAGFDASGHLVIGTASSANGQIVFNNSSNGNSITVVAGAATTNRTIYLPDGDGTLCLSQSISCGFLLIGPGSAQVDSSTNNSIYINKTGASGNLLALERSGTGVFTVSNGGALTIMSTSTSALSIQDGSSNPVFNVDTSGNIVQVGSSTTDSTGIVFVLDSSNAGTDPTGYNGAMYYNSTLGKFRCYESSAWVDCIGTRQVRSFIDSTSDAVVSTNNTTNYWDTAVENNNSYPNITPSSSTKAITGSVVMEVSSTTTADRSVQVRVERGIGSVPTCGSGTVVGARVSTFTTNNPETASSTVIFLDEPATTSVVYYTVCSDSNTNSGTGVTINRFRVTLEEAHNSN